MVTVQGLTKEFVREIGQSVRALDSLNLNIPRGELVVLMGPNGSGKSTLFRILDGQLQPDAGRIVWNGMDPKGQTQPMSEERSPHRVSHVPQDPRSLAFPEMALEEHLLMAELAGERARFWKRGITKARRERYRQLFERYEVRPLTEALSAPFRTLSGGWQQIFIILLAALGLTLTEKQDHVAGLLLLDEPTSALDEENARRCLDLIRTLHQDGLTILLATHDADLASALGDRLVMMRNGRVVGELRGEEITKVRIHERHS